MQPQLIFKRKSTILETGFTENYIKAKKLGIFLAENDISQDSIINDLTQFTKSDFLDGLEDGYNTKIIEYRKQLIHKTRDMYPHSNNLYETVCENLTTDLPTLNKLYEDNKQRTTPINSSQSSSSREDFVFTPPTRINFIQEPVFGKFQPWSKPSFSLKSQISSEPSEPVFNKFTSTSTSTSSDKPEDTSIPDVKKRKTRGSV